MRRDVGKVHPTGVHQVQDVSTVWPRIESEYRAAKGGENVVDHVTSADKLRQWQAPDPKLAYVRRWENIVGRGQLPLWRTTPVDLAQLGTGVTLYFCLLKWLAVLFALQSLVSLPTLILFFIGNGLPVDYLDVFPVSLSTLGNFHAYQVSDILGDLRITVLNDTDHLISRNDTADSALDESSYERTLSYFVSVMDMVNFFMLVAFVWWVRQATARVAAEADMRFAMPSDFAVFVEGLPACATKTEIRDHFSNLYQLEKRDWAWSGGGRWSRLRKKPRDPVPGKKAVQDASNVPPSHSRKQTKNDRSFYVGSWVCEVVVVTSAHCDLLRACLSERTLAEKFDEAKAKIVRLDKRASRGWLHGIERRLRELWLRRIVQQMRKLNSDLLVKGATERVMERELAQNRSRRHQRGMTPAYAAPNDGNAFAFVTFNHRESFERCIEDYRCASWAGRHQPEPMRFRNHFPLRVTIAEEPTNIKWENLGVGFLDGFLRRTLVNCAAMLLVLLGFVLVYTCHYYFREVQERLPDTSLCVIDLPAKYAGHYDLVDHERVVRRHPERDHLCPDKGMAWLSYESHSSHEYLNATLHRPSNNHSVIQSQFERCVLPCVYLDGYDVSDEIEEGLTGIDGTDKSRPRPSEQESRPFSYRNKECNTLAVQEGCPTHKEPATSGNIDDKCADQAATISRKTGQRADIQINNAYLTDQEALEVLATAIDSVQCCKPYSRPSTLRNCYCADVIANAIKSNGIFSAMSKLSPMDAMLCSQHGEMQIWVQVLNMLPAAVVVVVNMLLRVSIKWLSQNYERHKTMTTQEVSVASKAFVAQFLNTAVLLILLHAAAPDDSGDGVKTILKYGEFSDFSRMWYVQVATVVLLTMVINVVSPHVSPLFEALVLKPFARWYYVGRAGTQARLDRAYSGVRFSTTIRYSFLLNTLFVTLIYSSSLPLLLPFACLNFTLMYWFDKYALLRFYARPPAFDSSFALLAVRTMPLALWGHAAFAFWSFGNADLMPSVTLSEESWIDMGLFDSNNASVADHSTLEMIGSMRDYLSDIDTIGVRARAERFCALPQFCATIIMTMLVVYWVIKALFSGIPLFAASVTNCVMPLWEKHCSLLHSASAKTGFFKPFHAPALSLSSGSIIPAKREEGSNLPAFTEPFVTQAGQGRKKIEQRLEADGEFSPPGTLSSPKDKIGHVQRNSTVGFRRRPSMRHVCWSIDPETGLESCSWKMDGSFNGRKHKAGDVLRTWEIIARSNVHTYEPSQNPFYSALVSTARMHKAAIDATIDNEEEQY